MEGVHIETDFLAFAGVFLLSTRPHQLQNSNTSLFFSPFSFDIPPLLPVLWFSHLEFLNITSHLMETIKFEPTPMITPIVFVAIVVALFWAKAAPALLALLPATAAAARRAPSKKFIPKSVNYHFTRQVRSPFDHH